MFMISKRVVSAATQVNSIFENSMFCKIEHFGGCILKAEHLICRLQLVPEPLSPHCSLCGVCFFG